MAGKAYAGGPTNRWSPREQKAFCEGMAFRLQGTAIAFPITGNPWDNSNTEGDLEIAWDFGWTSADDDSPGALNPQNCALEGTVSA